MSNTLHTTLYNRLKDAGIENKYWARIILRAAKRGHFTKSNKDKAHCWSACACSRLHKSLLKKNPAAGPIDYGLTLLGTRFIGPIIENDFEYATKTLINIHNREAELLAEINNDK